jgi:DNA adenine methylase
MREIDDSIVANIAIPEEPMAPVFWYGGKGMIAKRHLPHLPHGRIYVEPYCGAASMFWHLPKPRPVEILNDLNKELINLFRCLQDPATFDELRHRLIWTPYSLDEFRHALQMPEDAPAVDRAWAMFVRQNMGFAGKAKTPGDWGRHTKNTQTIKAALGSRLSMLAKWHDRLSTVQLDSRDAREVIAYWDSPHTVFYIDPPYVKDTRKTLNVYQHETDDDHHQNLVKTLLQIKGQAMLSGYDTQLYAPLTDAGWETRKFNTSCHAAGRVRGSVLRGKNAATDHAARTEVIWIKRNPNRRLF